MNRSKRWSPEDDAKLRELFNSGVSPMRMAIRLGRTQRAVEVRIGLAEAAARSSSEWGAEKRVRFRARAAEVIRYFPGSASVQVCWPTLADLTRPMLTG